MWAAAKVSVSCRDDDVDLLMSQPILALISDDDALLAPVP